MPIRNSAVRSLCVLLGLLVAIRLCLPVRGHAQSSEATLTGTVTDPTGAVVPHARLSIKNVATGVVHRATTNGQGRYTTPNLLPGTYNITATASGFETTLRTGVNLTVGAQVLLNFALKVGSASQSVVVNSSAVNIQLASSDVKGVVSQRQVQGLPLNGRDWTTLATLQPGVDSMASEQSLSSSTDRTRRGYGVQMAISGARPTMDSYRIDGINVNGYANDGPGSVEGATLGVSAVQEFSVMTSNYSAAYGRTAGGIVNAQTKSGTNRLHGSLYEFVRNSAMDAANFFDNFNGLPKPNFSRNQFGAALGGPIRKDKSFIFGDYEGLRSTQGVTTSAFVPSAAVRGIGTAGGNGAGPSVVCSIPQPGPGGCSTQTLSQFVAAEGQTVPNPDPVTGINQAVLPFLALWQLPNAGLVGNGDQGIYAFNAITNTSEDFYDVRFDESFSPKDSMFATYQLDRAGQTLPDPNNDVSMFDNTDRQLLVVEETHIFNPSFVNSARFGLNHPTTTNGALGAINPAAGQLSLGMTSGEDNPQIDIPSFTSAQPGVNQLQILNVHESSYQGYDDLFWTKGKHSLKFGGAYENLRTDNYNPAPNGDFPFGSLYDPLNNGFLTNDPLLLAAPVPSVPFVHYLFITQIMGVYAADDITVTPRLTVNLGLRYEMATVPYEPHGRLSAFSSPFNQSTATDHVGKTIFSNPTLKNFEPRVGFAWDPFGNGKTSVRAGFGIFDVLPLNYQLGQFATNAAPFVENTSVSTSTTENVCGPSSNQSCALVPGDFPLLAFDKAAALGAQGLAQRIPYVEPHPKRNYVMQWNFAIQREILPNTMLMVAYVGSHGVHNEFRADDINTTLPVSTSSGYFFPGYNANGGLNGTTLSPLSGQMDTLQWIDSSIYNALEVQLEKRMSRGFEVGTSFTWGRSIDGGDGALASDSFLNSIPALFYFLPRYRRGPSDFNIEDNLTANYLWNLPTAMKSSALGRSLTGGWQVGGVFTATTGLPFTPQIANDPLGLGDAAPFAYPSRLRGSGCNPPTHPNNVTNYINLGCFTLPQEPGTLPNGVTCIPFSAVPGTCQNLLGNGGRNEIYGPGLLNLDFSAVKDTKLRENMTLELRGDFFNFLNHTDFKPPVDNAVLFNSDGTQAANAGQLDATSQDSREVQLAVQLNF
ncbi:MAG: carboxypeptidase regulatory-like domain-containing protein [Acidobacteriota bacterium]